MISNVDDYLAHDGMIGVGVIVRGGQTEAAAQLQKAATMMNGFKRQASYKLVVDLFAFFVANGCSFFKNPMPRAPGGGYQNAETAAGILEQLNLPGAENLAARLRSEMDRFDRGATPALVYQALTGEESRATFVRAVGAALGVPDALLRPPPQPQEMEVDDDHDA